MCRLMVENKEEVVEIESLALRVGLKEKWFSDITYYLTYGECPKHLTSKNTINLKLKSTKYVIVDDALYKGGLDAIFLRCVCVDKDQQENLLHYFHDKACGRHFSSTIVC